MRVDGASCYALQLESVCAAIQQQLNQSFDPNELRQAVRKLKIGDPLQREFTEGRTQFYDASAGPFPPTESARRAATSRKPRRSPAAIPGRTA